MSVLSPKRVILLVATALLALPMFAANPSPRLSPRMAFDEASGVGILFGGRNLTDAATGLEHATNETWTWNRNHWVQVFPANLPPARSAHSMAYDAAGERVIVFGGRNEATVVRQKFTLHGDTWAWKDGDWHDLAPAVAPPARFFAGMTYDTDRSRVLLFGGYQYTADGKSVEELTDTWEFDGTTWARVGEGGPVIAKPLLVFDAARHQTLMIGTNEDAEVAMYRWNTGTGKWDVVTASLLPPCANEAQVTYQVHNQRPVLAGGLCGDSSFAEETYEWDGSTWVEIEHPNFGQTTRQIDAAMTYDTAAQQVVRFGGHNTLTSTPDATTAAFRGRLWRNIRSSGGPEPRSMPIFARDASREVVWMFGGLSQNSLSTFADYLYDTWTYRDGSWTLYNAVGSEIPIGCIAPRGAMDTDRNVLVVLCEGNTLYEWNGAAWKTFNDLDPSPSSRRFAGFVYDQKLKKFVMFGGYDSLGTYRQDTWTWNGTAWTEVKPKTKPDRRAQMVMWFDPLAQKTIVYSGAGAKSVDHHAERFSDMWSFDGTEWTRMTESAAPGVRFAPQISVRPDGKLLLFGGLRATFDEQERVTQFYDDDLWVWDGASSSWSEVQTVNAPSPRQNAAFDYDPASGKFVLFGGFAGNFYFSDRWLWDGETWTVVPDVPSFRRRSARP